MKRLWVLTPLLAVAAAAQTTQRPDELGLFFGNGLGLAFRTVSTGAQSPLSMQGQVTTQGPNEGYRVVLDKSGRIVFAYIVHSEKTATEMQLQLRPVDQVQIRRAEWFPKIQPAGDVPTLATVRNFLPLRPGDSVQVDILYNPATGEKISDNIRVINEEPALRMQREMADERFSFAKVKVAIDGKTVAEMNAWMIGKAIKMRLPGRGEYYLLLRPTGDAPGAMAMIERNVLRIKIGGENLEIASATNLLQKAEHRIVWVYHIPESQLSKKIENADFACGDNMEQLKSVGSE